MLKLLNLIQLTTVFNPKEHVKRIPKRDVFFAIEWTVSLDIRPERLVSACLRYLKTERRLV